MASAMSFFSSSSSSCGRRDRQKKNYYTRKLQNNTTQPRPILISIRIHLHKNIIRQTMVVVHSRRRLKQNFLTNNNRNNNFKQTNKNAAFVHDYYLRMHLKYKMNKRHGAIRRASASEIIFIPILPTMFTSNISNK